MQQCNRPRPAAPSGAALAVRHPAPRTRSWLEGVKMMMRLYQQLTSRFSLARRWLTTILSQSSSAEQGRQSQAEPPFYVLCGDPCGDLKHRLELIYYDNHLGVRIGKRRYQMTRRGLRSTNFRRWLRLRLRMHPGVVHGLVVDLPKCDVRRLETNFKALMAQNQRYSILFRNCAQVTSRQLRDVGIAAPPWSLAWSPRQSFRWYSEHAKVRTPRRYGVASRFDEPARP
jgi:hypothetical protein